MAGVRVNSAAGPSRKALLVLVLLALLLHALVLLGGASSLSLQWRTEPQPGAVHVRMVAPALPSAAPRPLPKPKPRLQRTAPVAVAESAKDAPAGHSSPVEPQVGEQVGEQAVAPTEPATQALQGPQETVQPAPQEQAPVPSDAATAWPLVSLGALPPSALLHYQLTGMDRGLTYHASGELRWQHNATDYDLTLAVKAFLVGRRQWRSVGRIGATGLAPVRFSDSWRNERAAHFDREQQRIVFSSNSTPAVLEAGAQDQISLYVQLAAAVAGEPERFAPGARLQVQTATVRDALPWALVLEGQETLTLEGQSLKVSKWVCQPRNRYEARVEFWVAQAQSWLPVRIRITQASGSFIDLAWRNTEPLPPLPVQGDAQGRAKGS